MYSQYHSAKLCALCVSLRPDKCVEMPFWHITATTFQSAEYRKPMAGCELYCPHAGECVCVPLWACPVKTKLSHVSPSTLWKCSTKWLVCPFELNYHYLEKYTIWATEYTQFSFFVASLSVNLLLISLFVFIFRTEQLKELLVAAVYSLLFDIS